MTLHKLLGYVGVITATLLKLLNTSVAGYVWRRQAISRIMINQKAYDFGKKVVKIVSHKY